MITITMYHNGRIVREFQSSQIPIIGDYIGGEGGASYLVTRRVWLGGQLVSLITKIGP